MSSISEKTKLDKKLAFWYRLSGEQLEKKEYEANINKIAEFETVKYLFKNRSKIFGLFFNI